MLKNLMKSLTASRSATSESLDALDLIREGIAGKVAEIEQLRRAPLPVQDALSRFDLWADGAATRAIDSLSVDRLIDPSFQAAGLRLPVVTLPGQPVPNAQPAAEALLGLIVLACRPQLRKVVEGQLSDLVHGRETFSDKDRAARIAEAGKELRQALALEELACRHLEDAGVSVSRRADAQPELVLMTDAALTKSAG
jgi:hypothetical protein